MKRTDTSRRGFIKGALAAGAAPLVVPAQILYGASTPSNRVNLASIGVGNQGSGLFNTLLQPDWIRVVAVADCFRDRRETRAAQANQKYGGEVCKAYRDFREILARPDVDGVVVATPDHWHHGVTSLAMQAGKDVYCEKPLTLSIDDNKDLLAAARRYGRIFQYGTQQRSSTHIRVGCELVRAGVLDKLFRIEVDAPGGHKGGGSLEPAPVPGSGLRHVAWPVARSPLYPGPLFQPRFLPQYRLLDRLHRGLGRAPARRDDLGARRRSRLGAGFLRGHGPVRLRPL